jgi:hypothetical protein
VPTASPAIPRRRKVYLFSLAGARRRRLAEMRGTGGTARGDGRCSSGAGDEGTAVPAATVGGGNAPDTDPATIIEGSTAQEGVRFIANSSSRLAPTFVAIMLKPSGEIIMKSHGHRYAGNVSFSPGIPGGLARFSARPVLPCRRQRLRYRRWMTLQWKRHGASGDWLRHGAVAVRQPFLTAVPATKARRPPIAPVCGVCLAAAEANARR